MQFHVEAGGHGRRARKQRIVGRELAAHDQDLVPLTWLRVLARRIHLARHLEEAVAIAPDEEDLGQLQLEVAALRLALRCHLHQVGGLVVQAVGHVEVRLGQRVTRLDADGTFARQGVLDGDRLARRLRRLRHHGRRHQGRNRLDRPALFDEER